jgi:hypothetical protein
MSIKRLASYSYQRQRGWTYLLLVFALLFYIGHESQHDLPTVADLDTSQCEFCVKGSGPVGLHYDHESGSQFGFESFVYSFADDNTHFSFLGFSYTSRAPPVTG